MLGIDRPFLLAVATLEPRKGLDVLLEALARSEAPPLPLVIAGQPGWGGVDIDSECERLGLQPGRVRALGKVDDQVLALLYDRASLLVVPSRWEGFGLPVLEAMAAGCPVVVSDVPALREVGDDAVQAFPVGDSLTLARLLDLVVSDQSLRQAMSERGRRRAAAFSWDESAASLWELYSSLAG
jgi:glycosyltransferase involved in cell wall biosynthesis